LAEPTNFGQSEITEVSVPEIPREHPRLYLRASDLPALRRKAQSPLFLQEVASIKHSLGEPIANAFHHLLQPGVAAPNTGKNKCQLAIEQSSAALAKASDKKGNAEFLFMRTFHKAAIVYDWCYDQLTAQARSHFIQQFKRLANGFDGAGYPASPKTPSLVGHVAHGSLLGNQLAAGIAIHDEDPTMYAAAARVLLGEYRRVSNFLFPGITDLNGIYYARHDHFITANWMFRTIGLTDAFNPALARMPYEWLYSLRSDGRMLRSGDVVDDQNRSSMYRYVFSAVGAYYSDPLLVWMGEADIREQPYHEWRKTRWNQFYRLSSALLVLKFVFMPEELKRKALKDGRARLAGLPRVLHSPSPAGRMIFRTGWTSIKDGLASRDVIIDLKIGEYFIGNHQRRDFGSFQIYYKGPLAISSGLYQGSAPYGSSHWKNYYHQTVSTNGLLVNAESPSERPKFRANDGGQISPNKGNDHPGNLATLLNPRNGYRMATVTARSIGRRGRFAYIKGDLTNAYSNGALKVERAMLAIRTDHAAYPAILLVADHIRSSISEREQRFLLHSMTEPTVRGRTITITNEQPAYRADERPREGKFFGNYGGKLVVQNLFPRHAKIRSIRGFTVNGVSFPASKNGSNGEEGWGRIEIYAAGQERTDFLNVMTVMDAETPTAPEVKRLRTDHLMGARVLNYFAIFGVDGMPVPDGTPLAIKGDLGAYHVFVGSLAPGQWVLAGKSGKSFRASVTDETRSAMFSAVPPGVYALHLAAE
jgi:heparin/heparan-sulfate lyase